MQIYSKNDQNDHLQAAIVADGIFDFTARKSRMRCMPHTVHLAAIKGIQLLEVIGALTKNESKKAESRSSKQAYQETVTQADTQDADCAAAVRADEDDTETEAQENGSDGISLAVFKLRKIVKHVRVSPQRRRLWELTVKASVDGLDAELAEAQLMLILDVRTR
ncbi:hypothetical protein R3P38DRAFT_2534706 [Favolaschia claudopus]|uniref:Uncharacterized protein n=1 Tax=Favolaschia claudopus TaxID=2862362 RepID=A0AAW0B6R4_9AGAR